MSSEDPPPPDTTAEPNHTQEEESAAEPAASNDGGNENDELVKENKSPGEEKEEEAAPEEDDKKQDQVNDKGNEKEEEEEVDEQDIVELEEDAYSLMFIQSGCSIIFWYAAFVVLLQFIIVILFYWDLLELGDDNKLQIPITVDTNVRIAQFIALPLAVMSHEDCTTALWLVGAQYDPSILTRFPNATLQAWTLALVLRFIVGSSLIVISFVQIMQSTRITDLFLNLEAIVLVGNIDNFAFYLADKGFLKREMRIACAQVRTVKFRKSHGHHRTRVKRMLLFVCYAMLVVAWGFVALRQDQGVYLRQGACKSFSVQFGNEFLNIDAQKAADISKNTVRNNFAKQTEGATTVELLYAYFSGTYEISLDQPGRDRNYRAVYNEVTSTTRNKDINSLGGQFSYCKGESGGESGAWVFRIPALEPAWNRSTEDEDCPGWLLRSKPTEAFTLEEAPTDGWRVWTSDFVETETTFSYSCNDCESAVDCNYAGKCNDDVCECEPNILGPTCETELPCAQLFYIFYGLEASQFGFIGPFPLLLEDGRVVNSTENISGQDLLFVYGRPVYIFFFTEFGNFASRHTHDKLDDFLEAYPEDGQAYAVHYGGSRWFISQWNAPELKEIFFLVNANNNLFVHAYWDQLVARTVIGVSEPSDSFVPEGLEWEDILSSRSRGDYGPLLARVSTRATFACILDTCDGLPDNFCGDFGECVNGTCQCRDCYGGYFCEFDHDHPYVEPYAQTYAAGFGGFNEADNFDGNDYGLYARLYFQGDPNCTLNILRENSTFFIPDDVPFFPFEPDFMDNMTFIDSNMTFMDNNMTIGNNSTDMMMNGTNTQSSSETTMDNAQRRTMKSMFSSLTASGQFPVSKKSRKERQVEMFGDGRLSSKIFRNTKNNMKEKVNWV